jgi:hypothetical protein
MYSGYEISVKETDPTTIKTSKNTINSLKPSSNYIYMYVPPALTISSSDVFIYSSCMILTVNDDYFLEQHKPIYVCNGVMVFSLKYGLTIQILFRRASASKG